jgi:phage terminase large subunit
LTTSIAREVAKRHGSSGRPKTMAASLATRLLQAYPDPASIRIEWPCATYRNNPVGFFREVLGINPWSRQIEIIEAVRDHRRVAVASGHKVSKSNTAAGLALWFYCSFDNARVVLTSTTARQIDDILWRELRMMVDGAKETIDGEMRELARSGFKAGFRWITGHTAKEAEAVAGVSGKNLFYIVDEASGVGDPIYEAIEGNRAGGARVLLIGNPTRTEGEHFEAFHSKSKFYKTIRISSEETPNVVEGREVIPGLCERAWVEEKREEWGVESALYKIRVPLTAEMKPRWPFGAVSRSCESMAAPAFPRTQSSSTRSG